MNFCNRTEEVLAFVLGTMDQAGRASFESHLATCPVCSRELAIEQRIDRALAAPVEAPQELGERLGEALAVLAKPAGSRLHTPRILSWIAAAAVLTVLGWMISVRLLEGVLPPGAMGQLAGVLTRLTSSAGANLGTLIAAGSLTAAAVAIASLLPGE